MDDIAKPEALPTDDMIYAGTMDGYYTRAEVRNIYKAMIGAAPTPTLYQHDDGRYALALGDVARHKLTDGEPGWHRVPLHVVVNDAGDVGIDPIAEALPTGLPPIKAPIAPGGAS